MGAFLDQNLIPNPWTECLEKLKTVWQFLFDIVTNQEFTNVNLSDKITLAVQMTVFLVSVVALFTVQGAHLFDPDVVQILNFLTDVIQCLNHILFYLDKVITNLGEQGVLAGRALDQYIQLHTAGANLMTHYNSLAAHVNMPDESRIALMTLRNV